MCSSLAIGEGGEAMTGSFSSLDNPEMFETQKQMKMSMQQGIQL